MTFYNISYFIFHIILPIIINTKQCNKFCTLIYKNVEGRIIIAIEFTLIET